MLPLADDSLIWWNGSLLPAREIRVSPWDSGFTTGAVVFETLLALDGEVMAYSHHYNRLVGSAAIFGMVLPESQVLANACQELAVGYNHRRVRLRIMATAGPGVPGTGLPSGPPTVMVVALPAPAVLTPARLASVPWRRNPLSALAGIKSTAYAENLLALDAAKKAGADEAVILNTAGHLCEGATSNLWHINNGQLHTPGLDSGCLPGVTRQIVLELCQELNIQVIQTPQDANQLAPADALFLTSSIRGVHPADWYDGKLIASSTHPMVQQLQIALETGRTARRWV